VVLFVALLLALALPSFAHHTDAPTTVILVRHGEKATADPDTLLSDAGSARAKELARVLAGAGVTAIYTTQYQRTRLTAKPLADALKLEPVVVSSGATFAKELAKRIREQNAGGVVVVVGHSNSTADLARELGAANVPSIPETQFDDLFVVTLGEKVSFVPLRYGAATR
ncbi:MAG TPA: phosphoglycerate mutase family protein, partial [Thermoanaerobaculia bacterium]